MLLPTLFIAVTTLFQLRLSGALEVLNRSGVELNANGVHHCLGPTSAVIRWQLCFNTFDSVTSRPVSMLDNFMFPSFGVKSGATIRIHVTWSQVQKSASSSGLVMGTETGLVAGFNSPEMTVVAVFCNFQQWAQHMQMATRFGMNGTWINPSGGRVPFARCFHHRELRKNEVINFVYRTAPLAESESEPSQQSGDGIIVHNESSDDVTDLMILLVAVNPTKFLNFDTVAVNYSLSIRNPDILSNSQFFPLDSGYSEMSAYLQPIIILYIVFLALWAVFVVLWAVGVYSDGCKYSFKGRPYLVYLCTFILISRTIWYVVALCFWQQVSHDPDGVDNHAVYILIRAVNMFILFGFLMLLATGWGTQIMQMPKVNILATSILILAFTAVEMIYEANLMFANTIMFDMGVDLLFACWVLWIVYSEHMIRKGAIAMIYSSDYVSKVQRELRSLDTNDTNTIQHQSMYKDPKNMAMYSLISVYSKKLSFQRSVWITCITFASVKLILLCMRFFVFISYVPFFYIMFHETTDFLVLVRLCILIRNASRPLLVKL